MPAHKRFTIEERVRWGDVDAARIIFYGAYIHFFEFAETELFRAAGLHYGVMFDELKIWLPRVHLECDFHSAARLDDILEVNVWGFLIFHTLADKMKPPLSAFLNCTFIGYNVDSYYFCFYIWELL